MHGCMMTSTQVELVRAVLLLRCGKWRGLCQENVDSLPAVSVNAGLPEKRNCLHDQDSQLERHILVVDQGHQRPQLQMYTKPQHNEHLVRMSA